MGVGVALITPFKENRTIDFEALSNLIEYDIAGGVSYLVVMGTTAENPVLSKGERQEILDFVVKQNAGRVPIVFGIGGNDTVVVAEQMRKLNLKGVDAILSVVPYYNKPSQEGIYQHYKYLSYASPLPIIMYNVPGRTGVNMTAATCLRLAKEFPNIIAIKEASGNISQVSYILRDAPKDFTVISGEDNLSLAIIAAGGDGVISVSANAFPKKFTTLVASALKGDYITAQRCQNELLEVTDLLFAEGNPVGVKSALSTIGIIKNVLRLPLVKSTVELDAKIAAHIKKYNLQ